MGVKPVQPVRRLYQNLAGEARFCFYRSPVAEEPVQAQLCHELALGPDSESGQSNTRAGSHQKNPWDW